MEDPDLESISLKELLQQWPKDRSGQKCATLIRRHLLQDLLHSAITSEGTPLTAGIELGQTKAIAKLFQELRDLGGEAPEAPSFIPTTGMLNRDLTPEERAKRQPKQPEKK